MDLGRRAHRRAAPDPLASRTSAHLAYPPLHWNPYADTWVPATVTSPAVDGREYRALIADGYTALDGGALVRFPPDALEQLIDDQHEAFLDDDTGTVAQLCRVGDLLIVQRQEHDDSDDGLRWVENDRCYPDADGGYLVGAYQWRWTPA